MNAIQMFNDSIGKFALLTDPDVEYLKIKERIVRSDMPNETAIHLKYSLGSNVQATGHGDADTSNFSHGHIISRMPSKSQDIDAISDELDLMGESFMDELESIGISQSEKYIVTLSQVLQEVEETDIEDELDGIIGSALQNNLVGCLPLIWALSYKEDMYNFIKLNMVKRLRRLGKPTFYQEYCRKYLNGQYPDDERYNRYTDRVDRHGFEDDIPVDPPEYFIMRDFSVRRNPMLFHTMPLAKTPESLKKNSVDTHQVRFKLSVNTHCDIKNKIDNYIKRHEYLHTHILNAYSVDSVNKNRAKQTAISVQHTAFLAPLHTDCNGFMLLRQTIRYDLLSNAPRFVALTKLLNQYEIGTDELNNYILGGTPILSSDTIMNDDKFLFNVGIYLASISKTGRMKNVESVMKAVKDYIPSIGERIYRQWDGGSISSLPPIGDLVNMFLSNDTMVAGYNYLTVTVRDVYFRMYSGPLRRSKNNSFYRVCGDVGLNNYMNKCNFLLDNIINPMNDVYGFLNYGRAEMRQWISGIPIDKRYKEEFLSFIAK